MGSALAEESPFSGVENFSILTRPAEMTADGAAIVQNQSTYVFSGGGTGGHLFPGIAVAEELLARDNAARIVFAGSERAVETEIIADHGYDHRPLPVEPFATLRRSPLRFAWRNWRAMRVATQWLRREQPVVVIGLGGFASVPIVLAASRLRIPVILLEQNVVPGRATRWLLSRAALVCLSFEATAQSLPFRCVVCVTGNPVRRRIVQLLSTSVESNPQQRPTLLVLGGSQGAHALNAAMLHAGEALREPLSGWNIVHQTGKQQAEQVRQRYEQLGMQCLVEPFFNDLPGWYRRASVVISRAGATTLAELACAGCPAILVPYPNSLGDHQLLNARAFESAGAARIVEQHREPNATADSLVAQLSSVLLDHSSRNKMQQAMRSLAKPQAARNVADNLLQFAHKAHGLQPVGSPHISPSSITITPSRSNRTQQIDHH